MCFETHSFGSPVIIDYKYSVISKTYITSFSLFLLLFTSNVKISEGTFCHVEVHIYIYLIKMFQTTSRPNKHTNLLILCVRKDTKFISEKKLVPHFVTSL